MHLVSLNLTNLLIALYCGTMKCDPKDDRLSWRWFVLQGDLWKDHGELVAAAAPYLPGSFDKAPRNPVEKLNSGYKAWELLVYIFGLCPGLLCDILPEEYWVNLCKVTVAIRILHQRSITPVQLHHAYELILQFIKEFELLFYQRKVSRIHFCRQSIHGLVHLPPEVSRIGPDAYRSQWTMERTIGNLGEEIKQPSNPYANLSERGLQRAQMNALTVMIPQLATPEKGPPRGSISLDDGFVLLRAMDTSDRKAENQERTAILQFLRPSAVDTDMHENAVVKVRKWARLLLPNGQIARSAWKEKLKPLEHVRMSRNVKVCPNTCTV